MAPAHRKSRIIVLLAFLFFAGIAGIGICDFAAADPKKSVGIVVFDVDPEVAVNTANIMAVQTQDSCAEQFEVRYEAWFKTQSPARYLEERMMPGCGSQTGIMIREAAATSKPRANDFMDSLSRTLIDGLIL